MIIANSTGDFIEGSTATGILNIVYSITDDSNIHYSFIPHSLKQQTAEDTIRELPSNHYRVAVFAVVETGQPFPRAATKPKSILINGNKPLSGTSIQYLAAKLFVSDVKSKN